MLIRKPPRRLSHTRLDGLFDGRMLNTSVSMGACAFLSVNASDTPAKNTEQRS